MQRPLVIVSTLLLIAPAWADDGVLRFKFGPAGAKTPSGYRLITESDQYAAGKPGWLKTGHLSSADRPKGSPAARSFVYGNTAREGGAGTFKVDLPAGRYAVVFYAQATPAPTTATGCPTACASSTACSSSRAEPRPSSTGTTSTRSATP